MFSAALIETKLISLMFTLVLEQLFRDPTCVMLRSHCRVIR